MYRFLAEVHDAVSLRKITILEQTQGRKRGIRSHAEPRAGCPPCCRLWAAVWPCGAEVGYGYLPAIWARVGELFGAPKAKPEKGIDAFPRQCRLRQPAARTATGVCGVLRLTLIFSLPICFDAILCKNARQPRVCKAFGTRSGTGGRCAPRRENGDIAWT